MGDDFESKVELIFEGQEHSSVKQTSKRRTYKKIKFRICEVDVYRRRWSRQPVLSWKSGGGCEASFLKCLTRERRGGMWKTQLLGP
jgi:hypothetical protein